MSVATLEWYLRISEASEVAGMALLAFDYCLTFAREIEWLYDTKWTPARIHFTSLRYLPFLALAMAVLTSRIGTRYCYLAIATKVAYYLCVVLAEGMIIIRTYVFWKRNKRILIGSCTFGLICAVGSIVTSLIVTSQPADLAYEALSCFGAESKVSTAVSYFCLVTYEMIMLGLNWIAFRRIKRQYPPGRLITTLYRDGVTYVAATLGFSVSNAVVALAAPTSYTVTLNSAQMVLHTILACRIFFNLRETARQEEAVMLSTSLSEFRAAPQGSDGFGNTEEVERQ